MTEHTLVPIICEECLGTGQDHAVGEQGQPVPVPGRRKCWRCKGHGWDEKPLVPDSLAALYMELGSAADANERTEYDVFAPFPGADYEPTAESLANLEAFHDALEAVRAHPDYREGE